MYALKYHFVQSITCRRIAFYSQKIVYLFKAKIHYISKIFKVEGLNVECWPDQIDDKIQDMPSFRRILICDCDNDMDRDLNSSINIMSCFLSQNTLLASYQQFVDNLRQYRISNESQIWEHLKELLKESSFLEEYQLDNKGAKQEELIQIK